jgi:hypothetical protein
MHPPLFAALYTVVVVALAVRMLGLGITPVLWVVGAGLVAHEQWRKVLTGPEGFVAHFEPRLLLKGTRLVALVSVVFCILSLFLTWTRVEVPTRGSTPASRAAQGPPELRVVDVPRPSDDAFASLDVAVFGWDRPLSVFVELLLLGGLGVLALKPNAERPTWVRYLPLGAAVPSLVWGLVHMKLLTGPVVFLAGMLGVGFVAVVQAIPPKAPEPELPPDEYGDYGEYGENGEGADFGQYGNFDDPNGGGYDPNGGGYDPNGGDYGNGGYGNGNNGRGGNGGGYSGY